MQEIVIGDRSYKVARTKDDSIIQLNGEDRSIDMIEVGKGRYHVIIDHRSYKIDVIEQDDKAPVIKVNGRVYQPTVKDDTDLLLERLGMNIKAKKEVKELKAPMPGLVLNVPVEPGQSVSEGDALIVLEAMKMENVLKSPTDAVVKAIHVKDGEAIDKNTLLISFE